MTATTTTTATGTATGTVREINSVEEYEALTAAGGLFLIDFCGPCKAIAPKIDELAASLTGKPIEFIKVDVDKLPQLSRTLAISAMPTFKLFHGKDVLGEVVGASYPKIDALVKTGLEKVERESKVKCEKVECEKVECEKVECEKVEGEKVECEKPETK